MEVYIGSYKIWTPIYTTIGVALSVGAFGAIQKGVFVSCSAGNDGPAMSIVSNFAPWILTVGATSIDRGFPGYVSLLSSIVTYKGLSIYNGSQLPVLPVVYAGSVSHMGLNGSLCEKGTLDPNLVKGKIVMCDRGKNPRVEKGFVVQEADGIGMALANGPESGEELIVDAHFVPAVVIGEKAGNDLRTYLKNHSETNGTIHVLGTRYNIEPSPVVAAFSSRGPNPVSPEILKPDIVAPGLNILAAWPPKASPTGLDFDTREFDFNMASGTSMSCPHMSGIAATIMAYHPSWSPGSVRSAMMTTANHVGNDGKTIKDLATGHSATPFTMGAGSVNPLKAIVPGLVYDLTTDDYIYFLCAMKYSTDLISGLTDKITHCSGHERVANLNYPSFAVLFDTKKEGGEGLSIKHVRRATIVESKTQSAVYSVKVTMENNWVSVTVTPNALYFTMQNRTLTYVVVFKEIHRNIGSSTFGRLEWTDGSHVVSSPIAVTWN